MNLLSNQMIANNNMNFNMNNNINVVNPMMANQNFMNINPFQQQQQIIPQDMIKEEKMENIIKIVFKSIDNGGYYKQFYINCKLSEKVCNLIEKYRVKANDRNLNEIFLFNAKKLNPDSDLTLEKTGLSHNSWIEVIICGDVTN